MSRIKLLSGGARSDGHTLLMACLTAGDPNLTTTLVLMHSVVSQGGDIIKLVVPSTDFATSHLDVTDAAQATAARSCKRALQHGTTLALVVELVAHFRKTDQQTPVILQVSDSVFENTGSEPLARRAVEAGVDAIQLGHSAAGKDDNLLNTLKSAGMGTIYLAADEPAGAVVISTGLMALTEKHGSQLDQLLSSVGALLNNMRPAAEMV